MIEAVLLLLFLLLIMGVGFFVWRLLMGTPRTRRAILGRVIALSFIAIAVVTYLTYSVMNARTFQLFGEIIPKVITTQPLVALTFDDGPSPHTAEILSVLEEKEIKATFFLIGQHIEKLPDDAAAIIDAGHEVGNHTYSHKRMLLKSWAFIRNEIEQTEALIQRAGYPHVTHFRSPYGKKLILLPLYLSQIGKKNIFFDVEPETYNNVVNDTEQIIAHILTHTKPGSIILLHPENAGGLASRQAVPQVIDELQAQGYRFVTVSELLAAAE